MSNTRRSLYDQEILNTRDADICKPEILNRFWIERIENRNETSIDVLKGFLKGKPPKTWNGKDIERKEWSDVVDAEFKLILRNKDKQRFLNVFHHISGRDVLNVDKGEKFGISHQNLPRLDISRPLSGEDISDINSYMSKKKMSATVVVSTQGKVEKLATEGNKADTVFSIHSVGKIFTGIIILDLINRGILKESALAKPIEISESAKERLAEFPDILERLNSKSLTLHDLMIHKGGFGDIVKENADKIKAALIANKDQPVIPQMKNIEDFLQYADAEVGEEQQQKYSNLAFLLVGLAAEHAHAVYYKEHTDEVPDLTFMGMLQEYIKDPSGMTHLHDHAPKGAMVNEAEDMKDIIEPNEPTPEARFLVGNPSGGYWTSADDLRKFGEWLYKKYSKEPNFRRLVDRYGQEFTSNQLIGHQGESPSASAMLSVSLKDGRVIAALSNSGRHDAHELEEAVRTNLFSKQVMNINDEKVKSTMRQAKIPAISAAYVSDGKVTDEKRLAVDGSVVPEQQMFGAASLSKPVFSYLVLKLISEQKISLDTKLKDILPFDKFCEENDFKFDKSVTDDILKNVTVKMMLSHSSGLNLPNGKPIESQFEPGTQYSYSNLGLFYLQKAVEKRLSSNLQSLAQEYVFTPLHMDNSCFYRDYDICKMTSDNLEPQKIYIGIAPAKPDHLASARNP